MISIDEAKKIINDNTPQSRIILKDIRNCSGYVIAEDIFSPESSPAYTNSAMDGIAVQWQDVEPVQSGEKITLSIVGESSAGNPFNGKGIAGAAIRISTGAMMHNDFDTVVPIEDVEVNEGRVEILGVKKKNQHVRFEGEEFKSGDLLIKKVTNITSAQISILAQIGMADIKVYDRARVAVVVTGSELVNYHQPAKPHQIRDSNSVMLAAAVEESGATVVSTGLVKDDLESTVEAIRGVSENCDIIIFSGGVSVGPHDYVKKAAEIEGFVPHFWKVNQKPGKPLFFASSGNKIFFGLPGNPVSAFMCFKVYIEPVLIKFSGRPVNSKSVIAKITEQINNKGPRAQMIRVKISNINTNPILMPALNQGSHMLLSITESDGYIIVEPHSTLSEGDVVNVNLF